MTGPITPIVRHPHFRHLAAALRLAYTPSFIQAHRTISFANLIRDIEAVSFRRARLNIEEYQRVLSAYLATVRTAAPRLAVPEQALTWLFATIADHMQGGDTGTLIPSLLLGYASARDRFITPSALAKATGTDDSLWRRRAAEGDIPMAYIAGKQWLLPVSVVEIQYDLTIPDDTIDDPDAPPVPEAREFTEADYAQGLLRARDEGDGQ